MKVLVKAGPGWRSTARRMERMFRRVLRDELLPHSAPVVQLHVPPVMTHDELTAALRRVAVMPAGKQKAAITKPARKRSAEQVAPAPTEDGVNPKMAEPAPAPVCVGVDLASQPDVQVVQVVPAARHPHTPTPAAPMDPAQLEPVPASYEDALDWLLAHVAREGLNMAEVETRLAQLSTKQLLATCNAQRVKAGLSPYVMTERTA
jgi:hypothetical protein